MRRPIGLFALAALMTGASVLPASSIGLFVTGKSDSPPAATADAGPAVIVAKKTMRVPLPRLRPRNEPAPMVLAVPPPPSPAGVSNEVVGSIPVLPIVPAPTPAVRVVMDSPAPADPEPTPLPAPANAPMRVFDATPPVAAPVTMPATATPPEESDDLVGDPDTPFGKKDAPGARTGGGATPAVNTMRPPFELVRDLQILQDKIAQGSVAALADQKKLRALMDQQFAVIDAGVWLEARNANAAVTYVLSGGSPAILKRMQSLIPAPAVDENLLAGALAYVEGRETDARTFLQPIDVFDLPASMGGLVALAQSALAVRDDPAKAMRYLDVARLLAPGTLVEEAALRREIFVADQLKDGNKVEMLGRQYLQRFRHSVYAGNFRNRFAAAISHIDLSQNAEQAHRLEDMLAAVEPPARRELYLTLAIAALVKGNPAAAALAADKASELAVSGTGDDARARLYRAAAHLADAKMFDDASKDLAAISKDNLPDADRRLYDMVAITLTGVRSGTDLPKGTGSGKLDDSDTDLTPVFNRAGESIKAADALLAAAK